MRRPRARHVALFQYLLFALTFSALALTLPLASHAQVIIAQISDTHLGEVHSPHAFDNLRRTVDMVNARHPDAVIVSGDIGENYDEWLRARGILKWLHAPVYYAPGNHDVHSSDVEKYRKVFGPDYYRFQVKGVTFLVIDSQLLGNFDQFEAQSPPPMPPQTEAESQEMLSWLSRQGSGANADTRSTRRHWWNRRSNRGAQRQQSQSEADDNRRDNDSNADQRGGNIIIGIQHIPAERSNVLPDTKPYWVINEPYRSRELDLLHRLGVRHMLVGHWHVGNVFEQDGITWRVAPSTSRLLPWSSPLGFAMHTINSNGDVKTEFVPINAEP
ncbi:MAG TPA: metallophosphoesterase [Candidatus Angelobacter sp.]|jgi:3',5'-cyclic AMP phosphodiesterase CpdA|nr:metallophosphoesterase [Candidatus Angelobacter sp.]